jgi:hypothetical protein
MDKNNGLNQPRPAFEKLIIGPTMVLGENITGGHYMGCLRLGKQMVVGYEGAPSYWRLHSGFVSKSGYVGAFYRGFMPWGLLQCAEGVPVLFVQHESMNHLQEQGWSRNSAEKASGFLGGFAQALFVTPLQKVKVTVIASEQRLEPLQAIKTVIHQHGVLSLFDGLLPMILRRGLDWGIRFAVSSDVRNWVSQRKFADGQDCNLNMFELIGCGLVGGAASAITHPLDNIVTNSQKPVPTGTPHDFISVIRRMYRESGHKAFVRGWGIKVFDNAYHMAWMYGIGTVVYEWVDTTLYEPNHRR